MHRLVCLLAVAIVGCHAPPTVPRHPAELVAAAEVLHHGAPTSIDDLWDDATRHDVVCVGESHDEVLHHRFQRLVLRSMIAGRGERPLGVGFEMFQRPFQPWLQAYQRGTIDEATLRELSEWEERWGFGWEMYEPLVQDGHDYGLDLVALNAPREATRAAARRGLDALPPALRAQIAEELDLGDDDHRRFFWAATGLDPTQPGGHGGGHGGMDPERMYAAQVAWDETMAETAATWLGAPSERRQLLVIAGNGHCHDSAIVSRVIRRRPETAALTIQLRTEGREALAETRSDYLVTLPSSQSSPDAAP